MKVVLNILCWIFAIMCCYFPFAYFKGPMDKIEVKASHILVDTEQQALDLKKEIKNSKDFGEMAEKYSQCPSKVNKGDIGYNMRGMLVPEFEKAIFSLDRGVIAGPIKSREGWHLIRVSDIKYYSDRSNFDRRYF